MQINKSYVCKKLGLAYYFIRIDGASFSVKNTTGCRIVEELLACQTSAGARNNFVAAIPDPHKQAAGSDFDRLAELLCHKYGVFEAYGQPAPDARENAGDVAKELYAGMTARTKVAKCHIELTNYCNFECQMCYLRPVMKREASKAIKLSEFREIMRLLEEDGVIDIGLTGGEPFLNPEIYGILETLANTNCFVSVNTNGSVLDDRIVSALKRLRLRSIEVSIYGFSEGSYKRITNRMSFETVMRNVEKCTAENLPVRLKYTLQKGNIADVGAFKEYCEHKKMRYLITQGALVPDVCGNSAENLMLSSDEMGKLCAEKIIDPRPNTCGAKCHPATSRIAIDSCGNVFPCETLRIKLGNIFEGDPSQLIGENNRRLARLENVPSAESPECAACKIKQFCSVQACPAARYLATGSLGGAYRPACAQADIFQKINGKIQ
jgi:radical SAM protein with 4Fe4S-binding SPASM domain